MNPTPIIPCAGPCGGARLAATPHTHVRTELLRSPIGVRIGKEHTYRCTACGTERRYGLDA